MPLIRKCLPPLSALIAFEVAARLQSFTRASPELNVTQAAISRQIAVLEKFLGHSVFRRSRRGVTLKDEGRRLYGATSLALQHLVDALDELTLGAKPKGISIYTTTAFAYFWLMPRLPRFRAKYPGTSIQVISSDQDFDVYKDHCDVAILFGNGTWPGMEASLLYRECISAVASRSYLQRHRDLRSIGDIATGTLLHLDDEKRRWVDWARWLRTMGAQTSRSGDALYFNNYPTLLQAAANGQGIALGWHGLIQDQLSDKTLVEVLPNRMTTNQGYFVTHSTASAMRPEVQALLDWIVEESKGEDERSKERRAKRRRPLR